MQAQGGGEACDLFSSPRLAERPCVGRHPRLQAERRYTKMLVEFACTFSILSRLLQKVDHLQNCRRLPRPVIYRTGNWGISAKKQQVTRQITRRIKALPGRKLSRQGFTDLPLHKTSIKNLKESNRGSWKSNVNQHRHT